MFATWNKSHDKPRQHVKKQNHPFADKGPYSQSYDFSSSQAQMWELNPKEGWAPKNWCFPTVVLEKTHVSPLDCKEIKPLIPKGNQSWIFIGRTDAEAPIFWLPDATSQPIGNVALNLKVWGNSMFVAVRKQSEILFTALTITRQWWMDHWSCYSFHYLHQ